jgi:hypothetical protein
LVATIDFGDLAAFAGDSNDGDVALQTANLSYDFDGVAATAGRIATPIGYEVLEPWGNPHISRSRGWQAQPINHDGLTISGSADVVDLMVGVVNNFTVADTSGFNDLDDNVGVIGSIGAGISDGFSIYASGIFTEDASSLGGTTTDIVMANLILSGDLGDSGVNYAVEGNWRDNDSNAPGGSSTEFLNFGAYVGADLGDRFGVDLRIDWTDDEGITTNGIDTQIWSVTAPGSVELVAGVEFRVEFRHDEADDPIFAKESDLPGNESLDIVLAQLGWAPEVN